jgi:SAM-dependent methyltransferase
VRISDPPQGLLDHLTYDEREFLSKFNNEFAEEHFESRYYHKFEWFTQHLEGAEKLLNVGCSYGRETFALAWQLGASEAVGINVRDHELNYAQGLKDTITGLFSMLQRLKTMIEQLDQNLPPWVTQEQVLPRQIELNQGLLNWVKSWPSELHQDVVPSFLKQDITDTQIDSLQTDYFDLVYIRNVFHVLHEQKGEDALYLAAQNISRLVKTRVGRVIIVEPSLKNSNPCDFVKPYFDKAGLVMLQEERNVQSLGTDQKPDDENPKDFILSPVGYIFFKPE